MTTGAIQNTDISYSSSYKTDGDCVVPYLARPNVGSKYWCSGTGSGEQYMGFLFKYPTVVTGIYVKTSTHSFAINIYYQDIFKTNTDELQMYGPGSIADRAQVTTQSFSRSLKV